MIPISDENVTRRIPFCTWGLIAANIAVFVYQVSMPAEELEKFVYMWGLVPERLYPALTSHSLPALEAAFLPMLTHMFIHGSLLHLLGNIWALWVFGDNIEDRLGHGLFVLFYFVTGWTGAVLHSILNLDSLLPTVGASGAIAGVMGGYFLLFPFAWITVLIPIFIFPLFVKLPAAVYLLVWVLIQFLGGYASMAKPGMSGGIAFLAHLGGFAAGMLLVVLWAGKRQAARRGR